MATRPRRVGARGVPHVGKTDAERRSYIEQVVQGQGLSTTVATSLAPEGAGTDSPLPEGEGIIRRPAGTTRRRSNVRQPNWLERNRDDLLKWLLTVVVFGAIAASLSFTYVLNREVGEMHAEQKGAGRDIDDLRARMRSVEQRMDKLRDELFSKRR
jgi:hypothetical protein